MKSILISTLIAKPFINRDKASDKIALMAPNTIYIRRQLLLNFYIQFNTFNGRVSCVREFVQNINERVTNICVNTRNTSE